MMQRVLFWLAGLIPVLAAAACGAGGGSSIVTASHPGQAYRDSAGWTIEVPSGWHAVRFSDSKDGITAAGVQLSNIKLPPPTLIPGYPIQVNGQVLPEHGVGLIIATDTDPSLSHGKIAVPSLPLPWPAESHGWAIASAPPRSPIFETLWFRSDGMTYIAAAKIGWKASGTAQRALVRIVRSFEPKPASA